MIRLLNAVTALRRLQEPFPRLVGRRFPSLFRASFRDTVGGGVPTVRGIGRHPSMPSAWIGFMNSNLLASTVSSFTDVTVKSNRTGNIPRQEPLKSDSNRHSAISRSFYHLNYLSDEVWREPVHCSLFFQHRHDACTMLQSNHTHRTHVLFYAGTLIGARCQLCYWEVV